VPTSALEPPSALSLPLVPMCLLSVPLFVLEHHSLVSKWVREWRLLPVALALDLAKTLEQEL
jgi:hypothetical protein